MDPAVVELRQYTLHPDSRDTLMIDSDDVLLLWLFEIRPASEQPSASDARRTGMTSEFAHEGARVVAEAGRIPYRHGFAVVVADAWPEDTQTAAGPLGRPIATLVTEPAVNTFPALPVRVDAQVIVRIAAAPSTDALLEATTNPAWTRFVNGLGGRSTVTLALTPTSCSALC